MKSTLEPASNPEDSPLSRTMRKFALFPEQLQEWEESVENNELLKIGNYINCNIQSERKSILELYSTSICLLQKNQYPLLPELSSPTTKNSLRKKSMRDTLQTLSPIKPNCSHEMANDRDFIVSNNFPNKIIKKQQNRLKMIIKQAPSPKKKKQPKPIIKENKEIDTVPALVQRVTNFSKIAIRKKLPKLHSIKKQEQEPSQINPWEYLQILDEPIFSNF